MTTNQQLPAISASPARGPVPVAPDVPPLLLPIEAAKLLRVCLKTLQNHSDPTGSDPSKIPALKIGRAVRYSRAAVERWIAIRESGGLIRALQSQGSAPVVTDCTPDRTTVSTTD